MQITDVRIRIQSPDGESRVKATASIVIDGAFVVHELRVVDGANGVFVEMPRRKNSAGEYLDVAHPISVEARDAVQKAVLEAYREARVKVS